MLCDAHTTEWTRTLKYRKGLLTDALRQGGRGSFLSFFFNDSAYYPIISHGLTAIHANNVAALRWMCNKYPQTPEQIKIYYCFARLLGNKERIIQMLRDKYRTSMWSADNFENFTYHPEADCWFYQRKVVADFSALYPSVI
jgi:hypothetical protein